MQIRFADMQLDTQRFLLFRDGETVRLRPKAFDLLIHLARNRERVVPRDELVGLLWGETIVGAGSLSGLVNELRTALGERGNSDSSIRTVHARGYQFVADVRADAGEDPDALLERLNASDALEPLPAALMERLRDRLLRFLSDDIRSVVEAEGLQPLSDPVIASLFRQLAISDSRSDSDRLRGSESRPVMQALRPEHHMRVTRASTSKARRDGRRRDVG